MWISVHRDQFGEEQAGKLESFQNIFNAETIAFPLRVIKKSILKLFFPTGVGGGVFRHISLPKLHHPLIIRTPQYNS